MAPYRLIGLILLIVGVVVLGLAYQQSESLGDQFKHVFTGDYTEKTVWMTILGGIMAGLGVLTLVLPRRAP